MVLSIGKAHRTQHTEKCKGEKRKPPSHRETPTHNYNTSRELNYSIIPHIQNTLLDYHENNSKNIQVNHLPK